MQIALPLDEMTTQEKLTAMEALWADLSKDEEAYDSPLWHREVLECREAESGELVDWEVAKQKIRQDLCK